MILAIDPGCTESAYVLLSEVDLSVIEAKKVENEKLLLFLTYPLYNTINHIAIEMVASYGMAVGVEVFETVFWIGRFWETSQKHKHIKKERIYRKDEKMNLCHSMKATDANISQALVDRFAYGIPNKGKGIKKAPGWFYGFKDDIWQAYAVGVTYHDLHIKGVG